MAMKIVALTRPDGVPVYIVADSVAYFSEALSGESNGRTQICLVGGNVITVSNSLEFVKQAFGE